jgi:asparagine synthase (glutamine-hydrolysing)
MCGIAGYIIRSPIAINPTDQLKRMADEIAHRGPDDEGMFSSSSGEWCVGLAHRRLSIIDLAGGHQPLANQDRSVQIVFNGEIYNFQDIRDDLEGRGHSFRTNSDTEVIVHAYEEWGDGCIERLRGMFAFAIWDGKQQRLVLARDRFGKKPLFIAHVRGGIVFGSEIKSMLRFPGLNARVNVEAVWEYFSYRYVPAPATLFQGISKILPGCYVVWQRGQSSERRYFRPPDSALPGGHPASKNIVDQFVSELDEAVRIRMISDVPFGAFLSGGLDSSAVVAFMARHSARPIRTFSIGFAERAYSELEYARAVAHHFGTEHHELSVSERDLINYLPALVRYRDAPVSEPSDIPIYLLSVEARKSVKMVLTGEGADEILGGYPKHVFERFVHHYQVLPSFLRQRLIEPLVDSLPYQFRRVKTAIASLGVESFEERMPRWFGALSAAERTKLIALRPQMSTAVRPQFDCNGGGSPLRKVLCFDQTSWLPDNLLERGDRMTMAASLEARMPFMDHELATFVSRLPDTYRVRGRSTKWILRNAMKRILPDSILNRPKVGFRVPVNVWFQGPMRDYLFEHLIGAGSITAGYYNRAALLMMLSEHMTGKRNHEKLLWSLLNLEIWHKQYTPAS